MIKANAVFRVFSTPFWKAPGDMMAFKIGNIKRKKPLSKGQELLR